VKTIFFKDSILSFKATGVIGVGKRQGSRKQLLQKELQPNFHIRHFLTRVKAKLILPRDGILDENPALTMITLTDGSLQLQAQIIWNHS